MVDRVAVSVVGDGSVGKSTIIQNFEDDNFHQPVYKQTVGCDFFEKSIESKGNRISLQIFDIGGQSINSANLASYIGNSNCILLVYDTTNDESFRNLEDWMRSIRKFGRDKVQIVLVGNKVDMVGHRQVDATRHQMFIIDNNLAGGMFVSGKTGENVVKMFYKFASELCGVPLSDFELAIYDRVVPAYAAASDETEGRTEWADELEAMDQELERKKLRNQGIGECYCVIA